MASIVGGRCEGSGGIEIGASGAVLGTRAQYIGCMQWPWFQQLALRLPSQCAVCHAWPAAPVCESCVQLFAQPCVRCARCALPTPEGQALCGNCATSEVALDAALAAVPYAYPWSKLVLEFKFAQRPGWARSMALLMRSAPWVEPALDAADMLLPIPLSRARLQERGFNQALLLANALAPSKTKASLLLRIRDTPPQSSLSRSARLNNVQQAFAIEPLAQGAVAGKRIVLVDDVMTSGASLSAAARCLRQAGASHITALVFARAERGT